MECVEVHALHLAHLLPLHPPILILPLHPPVLSGFFNFNSPLQLRRSAALAALRMKSLALLPLAAGFALGAAGGWVALRPAARPAPAPAAADAARRSTSGAIAAATSTAAAATDFAALLHPTRLAPAEAAEALAAWLALPPLPSDAPAAELAERAAALRALLTVLPDAQFPALLAVLGTREGEAEKHLRWIAFDVWLERDPAAAARWAAAIVPGPAINRWARTRYATKAAEAWARRDFAAAYAWATAQPDADFARSLAGAILADLAAREPREALALAEARGAEFLAAVREDIFLTWATTDPAAAIQTLGADVFEDGSYESLRQGALVRWFDQDPAAAYAWVVSRHEQFGVVSFGELARNCADPAAIIAVLAGSPDAPKAFHHLGEFVDSWAHRDSAAARAWLTALPDAARRADLIEQITRSPGSFVRDPDGYLGLVALLPASAAREEEIGQFFAAWADRAPGATLAWLAAHDDPAYADAAARVQTTLLANLAARDPQAALAQAQALPDPAARAAALPGIVATWAQADPAAAAHWLGGQLATPGRAPDSRNTIATVVQAWSRRDPLAALRWIESLPEAEQRRDGLDYLDAADSSDRADLLTQITDETTRQQRLTRHLSSWLRTDVPAARAWMEAHEEIPADVAAQLLTAAPSPQP